MEHDTIHTSFSRLQWVKFIRVLKYNVLARGLGLISVALFVSSFLMAPILKTNSEASQPAEANTSIQHEEAIPIINIPKIDPFGELNSN